MGVKVLLADADRDFLRSFKKLLELSGYEVDTVFDGAQAISRISEGGFDLVVLEQNIPRVRTRDIIKLLNDEGIPVIVILNNNINSEILMDPVLANDYLSLPFFPDELVEAVEKEAKKKNAGAEVFSAPEGIEVDISANRLCGQVRLTNEEVRIFRSLAEGEKLSPKNIGSYINSLNNKLERMKKRTRIRYIMNEGYRLVINNE